LSAKAGEHVPVSEIPSAGTITAIASGEVGLSCLQWLLESGYSISHVFFGEEKATAIGEVCGKHNVLFSKFNRDSFLDLEASTWMLSLWNPFILTRGMLSKGQFHVNLHPSLVPYCRGNDTAAWALRTGVPTGVSLLEMDVGVDTAAVWAQREIAVDKFVTGAALLARMKVELISLFVNSWPSIYMGTVQPKPQPFVLPAHTRKQTNEDRVRALHEFSSAAELFNWVRSHDFTPTSMAELVVGDRTFSATLNLLEITNE
jgi:hypothetical protein